MKTKELKHYLQTNTATRSRLLAETSDEWEQPLPKRHLFVKLRQYARAFFEAGSEPRMIALTGLRGVGKTMLMWQTASAIYPHHCRQLYFIHLNELNRLGASLFDAIQVLEKDILRQPLPELDSPIVLLLDEAHDVEGWDKDLKILYDKCKKAFVLATGSSALLLHQSPDLATRWTLLRLFPFRFTEFIHAKSWQRDLQNQLLPDKGLGASLKQILFFSKDHRAVLKGLRELQPRITAYLDAIGAYFPQQPLQHLMHEYISYHNIARF